MATTELWLEKYKPRKYYELLTEERVNREILQWLKSWDEVVFKKKNLQLLNDFQINNINQNSTSYYEKHLLELNFKKHKYILISGPPGLGKSTLAQVISQMCGYNYQTINASDERTTESLINKIEDATKTHNIGFSKQQNKPTCLILDEIDGIDFGASDNKDVGHNIVQFIKSGGVSRNFSKKTNPQNKFKSKQSFNTGLNRKRQRKGSDDINNMSSEGGDNSEYDDNTKNNDDFDEDISKKKEKDEIMRPIICICNDLYSKSIISLKKDALIFNIKKVDESKLLNRLSLINKKEKLNLQDSLLDSIIKQANYDIRRCLNIMHLLSIQKQALNVFNLKNLDELSLVGQKDLNQNIFLVWRNILSNTGASNSNTNPNNNNNNNSYLYLKEQFNSVGDFELINNGLFHNYFSCFKPVVNNKNAYSNTDKDKDKDSNVKEELEKLTEITENFSYTERYYRKNKESTDYIFPALLIFKETISKKNKSNNTFGENYLNIEFPLKVNTFLSNYNKNMAVFKNLLSNYYTETLTYFTQTEFIVNILPILCQLLIPKIREMSPELLSRIEQKNLLLSVLIVLNLGLKLKVYDEDYEIVPNIFELTGFKVSESKTIEKSVDPQVLRKLLILSKEVDRISSLKSLVLSDVEENELEKFYPHYIEHDNKLVANNDSSALKANKKLFQGFNLGISRMDFKRNTNNLREEKESYVFFVKYHEGVTNTVRRKLKFNFFLG